MEWLTIRALATANLCSRGKPDVNHSLLNMIECNCFSLLVFCFNFCLSLFWYCCTREYFLRHGRVPEQSSESEEKIRNVVSWIEALMQDCTDWVLCSASEIGVHRTRVHQ